MGSATRCPPSSANMDSNREISPAADQLRRPLDSRNGVLLSPPNLPGWGGYPIVAELEKRTGLRARLENDANAGALANGDGRGPGLRPYRFPDFRTGMGAGLILNGRLYSGANGMAGRLGIFDCPTRSGGIRKPARLKASAAGPESPVWPGSRFGKPS